MTDTVNTNVLLDGEKNYHIQIQNISDGTGESAVVKADISGLTLAGAVPGHLSIQEVEWSIDGFDYVRLDWDATTDDEALILAGGGYKDFRSAGGLHDPLSTGATGDLILTTSGAASGCTYDILLKMRKHT